MPDYEQILMVPKCYNLEHLSRVEVLWSFIPAEIRKEIRGIIHHRNTQMCERTNIPSGFLQSGREWRLLHSLILQLINLMPFVQKISQ